MKTFKWESFQICLKFSLWDKLEIWPSDPSNFGIGDVFLFSGYLIVIKSIKIAIVINL